MGKRDKIMIIITALLVILLAFGLFYDRSKALIERTTPFELGERKIVAIDKQGMMFYRRGYQAKIEIDEETANYCVEFLSQYYGCEGVLLDSLEYGTQLYDEMSKENIHPVPDLDTSLWILAMSDNENSKYQISYIIDYEVNQKMYLYIYFNR
ncbi:MAG: hypothetical protein MJ153_00995 [Clostridia bacterium]|nr:hypothetical protein [Clostridia bacterium]